MLDTAHPTRPDSGCTSRFFPPDSLAGRTRDGATLLVTAAGVDTIVIPGLALLMANIAAYSGMASFSLRPDTGARMIPMVGALLTGCLLGGALFPRLLAWAMSGEGALRKAAPLAWIAAAPAVVLAGLQHYVFNEPLRVFANLFTGMAIATAYQLFFSRFPASRRGACFGVCLGAGLLCWNLLISLAQIMPKEEHAAFHPALVHVYHVHAAALVLLAALCSYSLILRPAALPPQKPCFAPSQGKTGWRSPVRAFMSIAVVVYFLNGILGGKLTPSFLTPPWLVPHILLRILVAGAACGAGWLMDKRPAPLFRRVLSACCWLFVLAPALSALGGGDTLHLVLQSAAGAAQVVFFVVCSVSVAALALDAATAAWYACCVYAIRTVSIVGYQIWTRVFDFGPGATVLAAAALAFLASSLMKKAEYALVPAGESLDETGGAAAPLSSGEESAPAPCGPSTKGTDLAEAGTATTDGMAAFLESGDLTPREAEVAALLLRGDDTAGMAAHLFISENTVKSHVRNVLHKFDAPNRYAFMAKMLKTANQGENRDATLAPDSPSTTDSAFSSDRPRD